MTLWVVYQDTDFMATPWEERLYNGVVGVIYCFCFFNLKDGRSRYRTAAFYAVTVVENFAFVAAYAAFSLRPLAAESRAGLAVGAAVLVVACTLLGLASMLLYYRFFHPEGPIHWCEKDDEEEIEVKPARASGGDAADQSPDFEVEDIEATPKRQPSVGGHSGVSPSGSVTPKRPPRKKNRVHYSRSFKDPCPRDNRYTPKRRVRLESGAKASLAGSPESVTTINEMNNIRHLQQVRNLIFHAINVFLTQNVSLLAHGQTRLCLRH